MLGLDICASADPSLNSSIECMMLCLCIIISNSSGSKEKRYFASINSKHLLTKVAESIDIFAPISQLGCLRASSGVLSCNSSSF